MPTEGGRKHASNASRCIRLIVTVDACKQFRTHRETGGWKTAYLFLLRLCQSLGFSFRLLLRRVLLQQRLSPQALRPDLRLQRLWSISVRSRRSRSKQRYHLRSSIGRRGQTARPSTTPCTWRIENRTRSTRAGRCILMMFSRFCRHLGWFSLTLTVTGVCRWDLWGRAHRTGLFGCWSGRGARRRLASLLG